MRHVILTELEIQLSVLSVESLLVRHGITPYLPYCHEDIVVWGAAAHRYTQPPRPLKPLLRPKETGDD